MIWLTVHFIYTIHYSAVGFAGTQSCNSELLPQVRRLAMCRAIPEFLFTCLLDAEC